MPKTKPIVKRSAVKRKKAPALKNTILTGDNLPILCGFADEFVDLIYLDPPFNTKRVYSATANSQAAGAHFKDIWTWADVDEPHWAEIKLRLPILADFLQSIAQIADQALVCYLIFIAQRLFELHRVLKPTGSLYLHCDPTASHYLKVVLDAMFGAGNFRNECLWLYAGGGVPKRDFPRKHDVILRYTKSDDYIFNVERKPYGEHNTTGERATDRGGTRAKKYHPQGTPINDWWADIKPLINWHDERTGYPTQKPLALLERIVKASSNAGDLVLDPFCGSGTTLVAAQNLNRHWLGIDVLSTAAMRPELQSTIHREP